MTYPNVFKITSANYDESADVLTLEAYLARSCIEPDVEIGADESTESFRITADFSQRRYEILDTTDHCGECEVSYPALVMAYALADYEKRYAALDHDASPGDVYAEAIVRFNVPNLQFDVV